MNFKGKKDKYQNKSKAIFKRSVENKFLKYFVVWVLINMNNTGKRLFLFTK